MKAVDLVVLLYAILSIVMGVLGFLGLTSGHHSVISLIAGGGIGILLIGTLVLVKTNPRVARISAAVLTLLPLGQFIPKFIKSGATEWYPAGIMVVASILTFAFLLGSHFLAMSKRQA